MADAGAPSWSAPLRPGRSRRVEVRGLGYHLREWGPADVPPVVLLHGGRDCAATFQFLVDALPADWHCIAPDWRGHGDSDWTSGTYWQSEFVTDLDALIRALDLPARFMLVGHSMGANVAGLYASLRPERVARLVLLDALGNLLDLTPVPIVETLLRQLRTVERRSTPPAYPSIAALAQRLIRANQRLGGPQAAFMAEALARPLPAGGFAWRKDPSFDRSFPTLHTTDEWGACWSRITAPVLCLFSSDRREHAVVGDPAEVARRAAFFANLRICTIAETGHNLHHDAPHAVAHALTDHLEGPST